MKRFDRKTVKFGDRLILRANPEVPISFKFMAFESDVVVSIDKDFMPERMPRDMILRQKDVAMPEEAC